MDRNSSTGLKAGAAAVDITPDFGIQIAGDIGRPRPVEEIRDPLFAKALVLEAGDTRACIVSTDVCMFNDRCAGEIRDRVQQQFGIPRNAVLLHATQNHSAPSVGHCLCRDDCKLIGPEYAWLRGGDERYIPVAVDGILKSVGAAIRNLAPAKIGAASGIDPRVAFNRRYVMRDGSVKCNPHGADRLNILHAEGPADPEVGVAAIAGSDGRLRSLLLHHTCHPTHGYPTRYVSADWPGAWSDAMKETCGKQCEALVLNGCCGNILHRHWADAKFVDDPQRMGRLLAETAADTLTRIEFKATSTIECASRTIKIPYRAPTPADLAKSATMLAAHPQPKFIKNAPDCVEWDWLYAVSILDLEQKRLANPDFNYEIQVLRLGEMAVVALMGEPFVEGQLAIKLASPVRHTYIAHMSNGYAGYVPTPLAFKGGGYETWTSNGSQLIPEALEMITAESVKLLKEVFAAEPAHA